MVPVTIILLVLVVAFVMSSWAYLFDSWKLRSGFSRIFSRQFVMMGGSGALVFLTVGTSVFVHGIVWPSWVLLLCAVGWAVASFRLLRRAWTDSTIRDREMRVQRTVNSGPGGKR